MSFSRRYRLDRRIGRGGMAEVFLARRLGPEGFERVVCLKRILAEQSRSPGFEAMFRDEARLAALLCHANIVQVFDFDRDDEGRLFIAMEYVHGTTLKHLMVHAKETGAGLPEGVVVTVAQGALQALHHASTHLHHGRPLNVIHRDVSPHNILLSTSGEVKLADFGIAKACVSAVRTRTGVVKGKLSYMSPEQAAGRRLDVRSDLYSLGVILWEMLAGRRLHGARKDVPPQVLLALPRDAAPAAEARPDVDPALAELVDAMLAVDPGRRPPSPAAALEVLARTGVEASTPLALGERVRRSRPPDPEPDGAMAPTAPQSVHPDPAETKDESPPDPLDSGDILTDAPGDSTPPAVSRPAERTPRPRPPRRWLVLAAAVAAGVTLAAAILLAGLERLSRELEVDVPPARTAAPAAPAPSSSPARPARRAPPPLDAAPPSQEADEPPAAAGTSASAAGPARRGSGTLDVNARPWADVYLDGRKVGQTPLRLPKVRAGRHVVQLVNPDLGAKKKIGVKVRAGATVAVSHDFSSVWHDPVPPSQE